MDTSLGLDVPRDSTIKIDPVQCDRLRMTLEECFGQQHLQVAPFPRNRRSGFAVSADPANLHPVRTFGVQWQVFVAILPQSDVLSIRVTEFRRRERDFPIGDLESLQTVQMQSEYHAFRPLRIGLFDNCLADSPRTVDGKDGRIIFDGDYDMIVIMFGRDLEREFVGRIDAAGVEYGG